MNYKEGKSFKYLGFSDKFSLGAEVLTLFVDFLGGSTFALGWGLGLGLAFGWAWPREGKSLFVARVGKSSWISGTVSRNIIFREDQEGSYVSLALIQE